MKAGVEREGGQQPCEGMATKTFTLRAVRALAAVAPEPRPLTRNLILK